MHNVRLSAGPLLTMADVCAAHVAHKVCAFAGKRSCMNDNTCTCTQKNDSTNTNNEAMVSSTTTNSIKSSKPSFTESNQLQNKYLCCTVGVTNTVFPCPVLHGHAIRLDGRAVHCGNSSLGVHIRLFRSSPATCAETFLG